jgi:hypothetical protein
MCPGCCPGIGMGVTANGHCGTLFQKRAYSNPTRTFEFPRTGCPLGEPHSGDGQAGLQIK